MVVTRSRWAHARRSMCGEEQKQPRPTRRGCSTRLTRLESAHTLPARRGHRPPRGTPSPSPGWAVARSPCRRFAPGPGNSLRLQRRSHAAQRRTLHVTAMALRPPPDFRTLRSDGDNLHFAQSLARPPGSRTTRCPDTPTRSRELAGRPSLSLRTAELIEEPPRLVVDRVRAARRDRFTELRAPKILPQLLGKYERGAPDLHAREDAPLYPPVNGIAPYTADVCDLRSAEQLFSPMFHMGSLE